MKKIYLFYALLIAIGFSIMFVACSNLVENSSTAITIASPTPTPIPPPLVVTIDKPIEIAEKPVVVKSVDNISNPQFKYILVHETTAYYLHKLESWKAEDGIVIFDCSICKNTIRVPEIDTAMYKKIGIKICWTDNAEICGGEPADWYELLAEK